MIRVEGLGKKYALGQNRQSARYTALRDVMAEAVKAPLRRWRAGAAANRVNRDDDEFWALRDVGLEVRHGEVVGIIGRNGAGKSTLLKILSRITEPTTGRITLKGRVASLLEVGTGFHPELTGRENIYLNGAILGMSRAEVKSKFTEIVAFAEVERFLDTPVKRYSSGMYVRLAFAVAAHLEPEILIVDEVLAVGDAEFQKKCLGKMSQVARGGRTVLFVSHNLSAVLNLCDRGIWLAAGRVMADGPVESAVESYVQGSQQQANSNAGPHILYQKPNSDAETRFSVSEVAIFDEKGNPLLAVTSRGYVTFRVSYTFPTPTPHGSLALIISSLHGGRLIVRESHPKELSPFTGMGTTGSAECTVVCLPLVEGTYHLGIGLAIHHTRALEWSEHLTSFTVSMQTQGANDLSEPDTRGCLSIDSRWQQVN